MHSSGDAAARGADICFQFGYDEDGCEVAAISRVVRGERMHKREGG